MDQQREHAATKPLQALIAWPQKQGQAAGGGLRNRRPIRRRISRRTVGKSPRHGAGSTIQPCGRPENVPAGEYTIRRYDSRDADILLSVSIAEGQQKTLDVTSQNISQVSTQPTGFCWVYAFTAEGVFLSGCQLDFAGAKSPPALLRHNDLGSVLTGDAGAEFAMTVSYPGFKPRSVPLVLRPGGMGPPAPDMFLRVFLERE
jgi:hypothetical protein